MDAMPSRLPRIPSAEPLDLRIAAAFIVLTLALVAPGIVHALTPADDQGVQDVASTLESQAREAVALIDRGDRMTQQAFAAELQDLGGAAEEARSNLLRQAVDPGAESRRNQVADAAGRLRDATEDASLAASDRSRIDRDRAALDTLIQGLHQLAGGS